MGGSPTVGNTRLTSGTPPAEESPVLGSASPPGNLPEEKRPSPGRGCWKTTKGQASYPPSGWPHVPSGGGSGSPLSLFPRGHSPVPPIRVQAVSPERRTPLHPWGSGWPRLGPSHGGVRAVGEPDEKLANRIPGYELRYRNPCGLE